MKLVNAYLTFHLCTPLPFKEMTFNVILRLLAIIFCVHQHMGVNSQFTGVLFLCLSNIFSISPVVKVYRRCEANRRWTSVDFSGCVLSSSEQQVLVIISLQTLITTDSSDQSVIESLHEEVCCCVALMLILDARFILTC